MQIIIFPGTEIAIGNELLKKRLFERSRSKKQTETRILKV